VPLSRIQSEILRLLAARRNPESYVADYTEHAGRRRGHWPSSSEIGSAMLDRHR
jgi:hypothetical protein